MLIIYVDADGCAVKNEVLKVANRYQLNVVMVANRTLAVPLDGRVEMVVVSGGFDAADDWIVGKVERGDIVVTTDILLADRCIKKQARVLGPKGQEWTEDSIGSAVAMRELMSHLRQTGEARGGPAPMDKKARSNFLSKLDYIIQGIRKQYRD